MTQMVGMRLFEVKISIISYGNTGIVSVYEKQLILPIVTIYGMSTIFSDKNYWKMFSETILSNRTLVNT